MAIKFNVKIASGRKVEVEVDSLNFKVASLKEILVEKLQIPVSEQRLILQGHMLKDDDDLGKYNVQSGCTIHMIRMAAPATHPAPAPQEQTASAVQSSNEGGADSLGDADTLATVLQQIAQSPYFQSVLENMHGNPSSVEQLLNTPELANDPVTRGHVQLLMQNPQAARAAWETLMARMGGAPAQAQQLTPQQLAAALGTTMTRLGIEGPPHGHVTPDDFDRAYQATIGRLRETFRDVQMTAPQHSMPANRQTERTTVAPGQSTSNTAETQERRIYVTREYIQTCLESALRAISR